MIKIKKLIRSVKCALHGIQYIMQGQNFVIEMWCGLIVLLLALILKITRFEFIALLLVILLILILETINTIFERIMDILQPRIHPYARVVKDMMAGAVLIACLGAIVIGGVIFIPYICNIIT